VEFLLNALDKCLVPSFPTLFPFVDDKKTYQFNNIPPRFNDFSVEFLSNHSAMYSASSDPIFLSVDSWENISVATYSKGLR
jgi:hypothetical protein